MAIGLLDDGLERGPDEGVPLGELGAKPRVLLSRNERPGSAADHLLARGFGEGFSRLEASGVVLMFGWRFYLIRVSNAW